MIIHFVKEIGESMTDVMERCKRIYPCSQITYAGRLDPLAHGLVIILTDEDLVLKYKYMSCIKIYEFKVIHGIQTDTFDILGIISNESGIDSLLFENIRQGEQIMEYPCYSSIPIKEYGNKPYWWCTKHNLSVINKPSKLITLFELIPLDIFTLSREELIKFVTEQIGTIKTDTFRQTEILERWSVIKDKTYVISSFRIKLSSGGYVRYFANKLGGCAYDICRKDYIQLQ